MRILITGGAGFIGSHIAEAFIEAGHNVFVVDNLSSGKLDNIIHLPDDNLEFLNLDIRDAKLIHESKRLGIDLICHQAAQPSLRTSIEHPDLDADINIIGTINVIKAARYCGAYLTFASTSAVYDPEESLHHESDCVKPHLPYGIAKATAERYIQDSGVSYTILRYGNVYGPRQIPVGENQLIPHCLNYLLHSKPFVINGDGLQTRDFVYVEDIARANLMAAEQKTQGIFNCGSGREKGYNVNEVCNTLDDIHFNIERQTIFEHGPAKEGEVRHTLLDSSLAYAILGWEANTHLVDGLRKTYQWAKSK